VTTVTDFEIRKASPRLSAVPRAYRNVVATQPTGACR
jgi:hypothetical protein